MAIKYFVIILFLSFFNFAFTQREVIDIKIDKNKSSIEIVSDSSFYIERKTLIKVDYKGDGRLNYIKNSEGKIRRISKEFYEISFPQNTNSKATVLKFYELTPRNKTKLLLTKAYQLKRIPPPLITIAGVKNDSALNIEHLIKDNYVRSFDTVNNQILKTHSFTINFSGEEPIRVKGNKIPINIKSKLYNIKEGETLTISDIYTILPDQSIYITKNSSVFLILTDQYSIGHRKYIKR